MTVVTEVVIMTSFSKKHLDNRPLSGQLFAILAMFYMNTNTFGFTKAVNMNTNTIIQSLNFRLLFTNTNTNINHTLHINNYVISYKFYFSELCIYVQ